MPARSRILGVISDTHGLLRPEALAALAGVDHIVHAGDIGAPQILEGLRTIAPVTAVRGNNDTGRWADVLPDSQIVELAGRRIYVLHDVAELDLEPAAAGLAAVIAGHSHKPRITHDQGVLFLNPGSAGPRRFTLPISLGRLHVTPAGIRGELITLSPS
jgi:uncharacterized protein